MTIKKRSVRIFDILCQLLAQKTLSTGQEIHITKLWFLIFTGDLILFLTGLCLCDPTDALSDILDFWPQLNLLAIDKFGISLINI